MASESANTAESAAANDSDEDAEKILRLAPRHAEAKVQPGSAPVAEPARTTAASLPAAGGKSLRRPLLFALLPVALLIGGYVYVTGGAVMSTDNAYVQADMVGISNDVSGIVSEVVVHDNQTVAKGDVLFKLDDAPFRLALDRADAQVGIIKNNLDAMRTTYKDMQAQIEQAQGRRRARPDQLRPAAEARRQQLHPAGDARRLAQHLAVRAAEAGLAQPAAGRHRSEPQRQPGRGDRRASPLQGCARRARRGRASARARASAGAVCGHRDQRAVAAAGPIPRRRGDGVQHRLDRSRLGRGEPEGDRADLRRAGPEGDASTSTPIRAMAWTGTVESISPASASSFSLLPAENSSGNWVKVVQRIPMRVRVDNEPGKPPLRVGMSVEVERRYRSCARRCRRSSPACSDRSGANMADAARRSCQCQSRRDHAPASSSPSSCRRSTPRSPTSRCPTCRAACRRAPTRSTGC